ncbi:MAG TPA: hypothetical protein VGF99_18165 [Myxococcota bacterium]
MFLPSSPARAVVALLVIVGVVTASGCGRKKKRRVVDAGVVEDVDGVEAGAGDAGPGDAGVGDAGVVDAGVVDAGAVDAGVVDADEIVVDAGFVVDAEMQGVVAVVAHACADERAQMLELVARAKTEPTASLTASRVLWGTDACRMDTAIRFGRGELLREVAKVTTDPVARKDLLAESAELKPAFATLMLLADACDALNDSNGAIEAWTQALPLASAAMQRSINARIERQRQKLVVEATFESRAALHFVARYEGDARKDLADRALAILDDARVKLERALGVVPPAPITVVLYTGDQYARAAVGPDWSGGVFDGKIRVRESQLKADRGTLEDLLFHEYLHALLRSTTVTSVPVWFNEGLAQWVEPDGDKDSIRARNKTLPRAALPSLATLSKSFATAATRREVTLRYDCALDLVDELAAWRGDGSFAEMFKRLGAGVAFDVAFDDVYGMDLATFEGRWQRRHP